MNSWRASGNQNECSSATARFMSVFTAAAQEVWKSTVPTCSADSAPPPWASCCANAGGHTRHITATAIAIQLLFMSLSWL